MTIQHREVLILEYNRYELRQPLGQLLDLKLLHGHALEWCFLFEVVQVLLPFLRAAQSMQVREENLEIKVEGCVQILRFYVQLRPEEANVVDLHFLLTVADEERSGNEG